MFEIIMFVAVTTAAIAVWKLQELAWYKNKSSYQLLLDKLEKDGFEEVNFIVDGLDMYFRVIHNPSEQETVVQVASAGTVIDYVFDFNGVACGIFAHN